MENQQQLAIALIRRYDENNVQQWLGILSERFNSLGFVVGQRLESESFRETVIREAAWELNLNHNEILVSKMAQINIELTVQLPLASEERPYAISFYNVELYRKLARETVNARKDIRWLTSEEIHNGKSNCGLQIDEDIVFWIKQTQVIQEWDSRI